MSDDTTATTGQSTVPRSVSAEASLANPTGQVPRRGDLPGAVDPTAPTPPTGSVAPSSLCADGGYEPDSGGGHDHDRVRDGGIVVRLEADGVLFHEGAGRSDGRWLSVDRDSLVSLDELC
ncbi:hypothetical protein ACFO0N_02980 [Halobium salinum]|uniref:Uncharacterized protein n=1 Tax=Halobium salinum TaxID=1364940 RepID=A0ABD5P816_9EURY|nr:hypothetical protein [Halobium salinum]